MKLLFFSKIIFNVLQDNNLKASTKAKDIHYSNQPKESSNNKNNNPSDSLNFLGGESQNNMENSDNSSDVIDSLDCMLHRQFLYLSKSSLAEAR